MKKYLIDLIHCIKCKSEKFEINKDSIVCINCNEIIEYKNNKFYFTKKFFETETWDGSQLFDFDIFERTSNIKMPNIIHGPKIANLRNYLKLKDEDIAINLGGGSNKFEKIINFDLGNYENVDILGHLDKLPFRDNIADLIISNSVLEHVQDYIEVLNESKRILKNGGFFYLCVPCVSARHHKLDYHRWTMPGLVRLVNNLDLEIIEKGVCRGPEMMVWYALETYLVYRTDPGFLREVLRKLIFLLTRNLQYFPAKNNEKTQAISVTNYVIAKKK